MKYLAARQPSQGGVNRREGPCSVDVGVAAGNAVVRKERFVARRAAAWDHILSVVFVQPDVGDVALTDGSVRR